MGSKDLVLELLEKNKNKYISGEDMARLLGLSRNAIWKSINELRKQGFAIDAIKNKGYMLSSDNDILSVPGIKTFLDAKSQEICDILLFDILDSTNKKAKELAIDGAAHGTVIVANEQLDGKAHNGNSFKSPAGGIYMSVILSPDKISFNEPSDISQLSAYAVGVTLEELLGLNIEIKKATDIYSSGKKIAGILNESASDFETGNLQWIIIGIGIPEKTACSRNEIVAAIINKLLSSDDGLLENVKKYYEKHHDFKS